MKLHELSVKRPVAVTMVVMIFVVIGAYALSMLPIEMMPEMDLSMAIISTSYPNVGAKEVETLITENIENAVSSVAGIDTITSQSSEGSSLIMVQFNAGTDMDEAVQDMEDNIDLYSQFLPEDANDPFVIKFDMSMMPAALISVGYEGYDNVQTMKYVEDNLQSKLESVAGVASVTVSGAEEREIQVVIDPEKLFGYNMTLSDVVTAVAMQNSNLPAGQTDGMGKNLSVRLKGKFENMQDIECVPITTATGQIIYLRDVATVKDTYSEVSSYSRLNNRSAISISIAKESDANTVDVVNGVMDVIEACVAADPKLNYNVMMEQASYIENAINSVANSALTGGCLAILVLLLFLASMRTSLVIGISMPISIVTTFIGMYFSGMTLNVVSLGGLSLGVGMLVDNAVVVIENIFRRRTEFNEDAKTAAISGSGEVVGAVIASVLTTCIVYVPILFVQNMMAEMFKQLAFAIIFSQCASLLTTFLLVPMLSAKIEHTGGSNKKLDFIFKPFNRFLDKTFDFYERSLRWTLENRRKFVGAVMGIFVLSLVVLGILGMELMPATDEGLISVSIELPAGAMLEDTNDITVMAESVILGHEDVENVYASVGSGMISIMGSAENSASLIVSLKDKRHKTTSEVVQEIRESLSDISGATISVDESSTSISMSSDELSFSFTSSDEAALEEYVIKAEQILLNQVPGVVETSTSISETQPEVNIKINPDKASRYGIGTATAASYVSHALGGTTASKYTDNGSEYDIVVKYPENYVKDYNELKNLRFKTLTGQWITIGDIADITVDQSSTMLQRIDQKRVLTITASLFGTDMATANRQFNQLLANSPDLPQGVTASTTGTYEVMIDAMISLVQAILLGILLMYMVMAAQFENLIEPLIILFTLPLAMIGVVLSLVIARSPLSVVSCVGILMLVGIVVNNAILLIDFTKTAKIERPELSRTDILVFSGKSRMRPVLMTSLTSVLGFLPMALSTAEGSEMMRPLAVVLVGGLLVGTILTLVFIPVIYSIVDDKLIKAAEKKNAKKQQKAKTAAASK